MSQSARRAHRDDNHAKCRHRDAFGNFAESSHRRRGNLRTSCVLAGRNFFPQHSGGYKLRARQAAARNFRPLTRFQMFSAVRGREVRNFAGTPFAGYIQSNMHDSPGARRQNLNRNPLNLYAREAVTSASLIHLKIPRWMKTLRDRGKSKFRVYGT